MNPFGFGFSLDFILDWIKGLVAEAFYSVIGLIATLLSTTPDVTALPQIQVLTQRATWVVDTVFVLAFIAAGVLTMAAGGDERARYTAKDLAPRLVVGFIAAHFSTLLCAQAIALANSLAASLFETGPSGNGAVAAIRTQVDAASADPETGVLTVVLIGLITVLLVSTLFSFIGRFATLITLTAAGPLALACHALPHTDPIARLWWRAFAGCLAIPVAQALTLAAGQLMLTDPHAVLTSVGIADDPAGVVNMLVVVVLLWTTVRIPKLMRTYVLRTPGGRGVGAQVMRVVVMRQGARAVRAASGAP